MKNNWKEQAHQEIERIFRVLLPQYGFAVREEQISLCHFMLDTLLQNHLALCDAGVGIGKTYAYLTACVMMQKFYPKNWNVPAQPVVISTSSIALQNAVMKEYIPFLSRVFLKHHILSEPIRAVVRKGKERFVCDIRLFQRLHAVREKKKNKINLDALQSLIYHYDLDCVTGLSGFDRRMVCVPRACEKDCRKRNLCRYHQYLKEAKSKDIWIQVCNHNYLLADAAHRSKNLSPLLNDYGALIVDEAHKLPDAAQQMYGYRISPDDLEEICTLLEKEKRLHASQRLREKFRCFLDDFGCDPCTKDMQRTDFCLTPSCKSALGEAINLLHHTTKRLTPYLPRWMTHRLEETAKILTLFYTADQQYVFYLEYGQQGIPTLCAVSRNLPAQLGQALWEKKIPTVLTSGTLAAGQQFERTKQVLGLSGKQNVDSFTAVSPFDYEKNCLLYLPDHLYPSRRRIECLAKEIVRLVRATFGHTLVLFPSYSLMNAVYQQSKDRFTYPLLSVWRQSQNVISQFKQIPNAVLFAAGSCWEGVDFPGDMVSSLIIARLPFPVPDPLREAERKKYPSLQEYIKAAVVPDMQKKLRQGFGRAIRTETDTCVVSILDHRAAPGQRYHKAVLEILPPLPITGDLKDVKLFILKHKNPDYFQ